MKSIPTPVMALILVSTMVLVFPGELRAGNRLLPFQGRLTAASGSPLPDGARVIQFKIYDAPVGGRTVWNGEVQNLSLNAGLVNTVLGTKASLEGVDFNLNLYLEVTVDANGDGQVTLADPPLLPRQSILPAIFARESGNTQHLGGYDWSALFGTNNPAEGTLLPSKIADGSLNTVKLGDGAVTAAKLASGAVTRPKIDTTGASAGQALAYDGNQVIWANINAVNADHAAHAANAALLDGFDWASCFNNANPANGELNVASMSSRGSLTVAGNALFNGPATTVQGSLVAPSVGINMSLNNWGLYLRAVGDFNHYLRWGNSLGTSGAGVDGPLLVGNGGGVLGAAGNWTLRWNNTGTVQTRGAINSGSDRNLKENFEGIDPSHVLEKVVSLPISRWNYKDHPDAPHLGPVAQDFQAAFGLGSDDKFIATVDADGVALAAIQGLNSKVDQRSKEVFDLIREQQKQIEALRVQIEALRHAPR